MSHNDDTLWADGRGAGKQSNHALFKLNQPVQIDSASEDHDALVVEYFIVSHSHPHFPQPETMIFIANQDGEITDSGGLYRVIGHQPARVVADEFVAKLIEHGARNGK